MISESYGIGKSVNPVDALAKFGRKTLQMEQQVSSFILAVITPIFEIDRSQWKLEKKYKKKKDKMLLRESRDILKPLLDKLIKLKIINKMLQAEEL